MNASEQKEMDMMKDVMKPENMVALIRQMSS
jgi:hypothetical protein